MVVDIDKKRISNVVRKTWTERRISLPKNVIMKRFEEKVIK